jgi:hypothetical protein
MIFDTRSLVVFVASWPDENGALPEWVQHIEDAGFVVLHPNFDWKNEIGQKTAEMLKVSDEVKSLPDEILARDLFSLKCSRLQIFDVDRDSGEHFMALAYALGIQTVVVSNKFFGIPLYFAPAVDCILKPKSICDYLEKLKKPH